ncbi:MAG: hypothetical protein J6J43_01810 [Oscillospiraceae bacterium]|nr:hypothetical protein [Oscillospiraceae bacterium]
MKKLLSMLLVVVLCLSMTATVLAAEDDFVPSITYKPMPEFAGERADDGCLLIGYLEDESGNEIAGVHVRPNGTIYIDGLHEDGMEEDHACLVVTPLADAETDPKIPEESRELLLWVYQQILEQGMNFFADCPELAGAVTAVLGEDATINDLVVLQLYDVTVLCDELEEYLEPEGTTICLDFDLQLDPETFVSVLAYKGGKWNMIEDVEILEDGSVTCTTYENFCPVAVLVPADDAADVAAVQAPDTGDALTDRAVVWASVMGASLIAIVALVLVLRKRKAAN